MPATSSSNVPASTGVPVSYLLFEQRKGPAVEDLEGSGVALGEDRRAIGGIGIAVEIGAFVDKALTVEVDRDAVRVGEAVGLVGQPQIAVGRRVGVDWRGVPSGPVAKALSVDRQQLADHLAGVVA